MLPHGTYILSESKFKTPRISPILKSVKIGPHENKAFYSTCIKITTTVSPHWDIIPQPHYYDIFPDPMQLLDNGLNSFQLPSMSWALD